MVVIGFDFGYKRIGMAVGQSVTQTASPLPWVPARDGVPNWSIVEKAIDDWRPDRLIVGHPLNMDGSCQRVTQAARRFANKLAARTRIEVVLVDERLSTVEARSQLFEQGAYASIHPDKPIDSYAAMVITEQYLLSVCNDDCSGSP